MAREMRDCVLGERCDFETGTEWRRKEAAKRRGEWCRRRDQEASKVLGGRTSSKECFRDSCSGVRCAILSICVVPVFDVRVELAVKLRVKLRG